MRSSDVEELPPLKKAKLQVPMEKKRSAIAERILHEELLLDLLKQQNARARQTLLKLEVSSKIRL